MNQENEAALVLVTGASGFIAKQCILQLLQAGYRVRGTLRRLECEQELRHTFTKHIDARDRLEFAPADLQTDQGWSDAAAGCRFILHIASPVPANMPRDENALVDTARDGTMRVLQAAVDAGVQRVVLTSSISAIILGHEPDREVFTEEDWSNTGVKIGAYGRSKTLAERAAWDFVASLPPSKRLELTVINPGDVIGPILDEHLPLSISIISRLVSGEAPGCPHIGFYLVDVRDVAAAHLLALRARQAVGHRFICLNEFWWMRDIAAVLDQLLAGRGYRIHTRHIPDFIVHIYALFDPAVRFISPMLGRSLNLSSERLRERLNWQPRSVKDSIEETAECLVALGQ